MPGHSADNKMITDTLPVEQLKVGMRIIGFEDVPRIFASLKEESIRFLQRYEFAQISIVRGEGLEKQSLELSADELKVGDQVIRMGSMNKDLKINSKETIDRLRQFGFLEVIVNFALKTEEDATKYNKKTEKRDKEQARGELHFLQDTIYESEKLFETGTEILQELFDYKEGKEIDIRAVDALAKDLSRNINKEVNASNVLTVLKDHDEYTFRHCIDVSAQVLKTCKYLGNYSEKELEVVALGGLLHDIGKSKIPVEIINKPGKLNEVEWSYMKSHPTYSAQMIEGLGLDKRTLSIAYHHHIRKDGTGYPNKPFSQVDELGRITAIADVYQALVTKRPYKITDPPNVALQKISEWTTTDFDEVLVEKFIRAFGVYPPGSLVRLNDERIAFVVKSSESSVRPQVVVVKDANGNMLGQQEFVDLAHPNFKQFYITQALDHRKFFDNNAAEVFSNLDF